MFYRWRITPKFSRKFSTHPARLFMFETNVYVDAELKVVTEADAPGVSALRKEMIRSSWQATTRTSLPTKRSLPGWIKWQAISHL